MWQYVCEQCNVVIELRQDIRYIKIEDENGKPKIKPIESCVTCIEKLKGKLSVETTAVNN